MRTSVPCSTSGLGVASRGARRSVVRYKCRSSSQDCQPSPSLRQLNDPSPSPSQSKPPPSQSKPSQSQSKPSQSLPELPISRRSVNLAAMSAFVANWLSEEEAAEASKLGSVVDKAWEGVGGGPADLFFPGEFEGSWDVLSTLTKVDMPLGEDFVPDMKVVNRAQSELNQPMKYSINFFRNSQGRVVPDRRFNTASLMEMYYGTEIDFLNRIKWDVDDPNTLRLSLPGGMSAFTRVTRRSEDVIGADRLNTSEFFEQVFDNPSYSNAPKVTANQCFTKYKWRSEQEAALDGGPVIVATQVVSDYLTTETGEQKMMQAMGKAVAIYTYRMAFQRKKKSEIMPLSPVEESESQLTV